jgi:hypothetical protein
VKRVRQRHGGAGRLIRQPVRRLLQRTVGLSAALVAVSAPMARSDTIEAGVHRDPGSPAGKEYAIPLTDARETGGGHGLFGAGITVSAGAGAAQGQRAGSRRAVIGGARFGYDASARSGSRPGSATVTSGPGAGRSASRRRAAAPHAGALGEGAAAPAVQAEGGGGIAWVWTLTGAGVVVALGTLAGCALARRPQGRNPRPS